jgi:hypothetical protein
VWSGKAACNGSTSTRVSTQGALLQLLLTHLLLLLLLQVLGAVSDALGTAYNAVRPEVQSAALPVKVRHSVNARG